MGAKMSFSRWGYEFDGAYLDPTQQSSRAGVYVIWCKSGDDWKVLDVGESEDVKARLANHERAAC